MFAPTAWTIAITITLKNLFDSRRCRWRLCTQALFSVYRRRSWSRVWWELWGVMESGYVSPSVYVAANVREIILLLPIEVIIIIN